MCAMLATIGLTSPRPSCHKAHTPNTTPIRASRTWSSRRLLTSIATAQPMRPKIAPEAPTVMGFVAILTEAVDGRPVDEVLSVRDDLLDRMGLTQVLGILRARGLRAILGHVKRGLLAASTPTGKDSP